MNCNRLLAAFLLASLYGWFLSSAAYGQLFQNVAPELNLNAGGSYGVPFWYDYDNDGDLDLLETFRFGDRDRIYRNDGGSFTDMMDIGLSTTSDAGHTTPMDFDHDGDLDIYMNCYSTDIMLLVNNQGQFQNQSVQLGLPARGGGRDFKWIDFNQDGWMDLLIAFLDGWQLFRNDEGTQFTDITSSTNLPQITNISNVMECDYDRDNDVDLYVTRIGASNFLYNNRGGGVFVDVTDEAGLAGVPSNMGCAWVDFNHDKYPDLITPDTDHHGIWLNNQDGAFVAMTVHGADADFTGAPWPGGANYAIADFDMDGDDDVYACRADLPNQFFRQDSLHDLDIWFTEIGEALGMDLMGDGFGSWGDYDDDRDLDLFVSVHNQAKRLFRNNINSALSWEVLVLGPNGERDRWHSRAELYAHGSDNLLMTSELNYCGANRNGLRHYFGFDPTASYDIQLYFEDGSVMTPAEFPQLANIVPSASDNLITVYENQQVTRGEDRGAEVASDIRLAPAYPNPFNSSTTIRFSVRGNQPARVAIYDIGGKLVQVLLNRQVSEGSHELQWDATNSPTGIYWIRLTSGDFSATEKVLLLK